MCVCVCDLMCVCRVCGICQLHPLTHAAVTAVMGDLATSSATADNAKEQARLKELQKEKAKGTFRYLHCSLSLLCAW